MISPLFRHGDALVVGAIFIALLAFMWWDVEMENRRKKRDGRNRWS